MAAGRIRLPRGFANIRKEAFDADHSEVAAISWPALSAAGAAGRVGAAATARRRGAARKRPRSDLSDLPAICVAPIVHCRGTAARGRLHRYPLCGRAPGASRSAGLAARGEADFLLNFAAPLSDSDGCRRAPHRHRLACTPGASSCSRTTPIHTHRRPQGQERRRAGHRLEPARLPRQHGNLRRSRPEQGHQLGHEFIPQAKGTLRRR